MEYTMILVPSVIQRSINCIIFNNLQMNQRFIAILIVLLLVQIHSLDHSIKTLRDNWKMQIVSCPGGFQSFSNKEFNVTVPSTLHLNLEKQI